MNRIIVFVFCIAIFAVSAYTAYAQRDRDTYTNVQPIEVAGHVRLAGSGEPASNVIVRLERFGGGIIDQMPTDERGRFRFGGLGRGYYTVVIESPGFQPARQPADLQVVFRAFLVFELSRTELGLNPVATLDARIPADARVEYEEAHAILRDKKPRDAVRHLERAVTIYPNFFEAYLLMGTALMDLRQWPEAQAAFMRALEVKPGQPVALVALGEAYWRQKRYGDAERSLIEGLKADDKAWHGHFTLARLYWEKGEVTKAAPSVGRTLQLKPDLAEAHLLAGNILLKLGQPGRALIEYEEYLRLAPKGEFAAETRDIVQKLKTADIRSP